MLSTINFRKGITVSQAQDMSDQLTQFLGDYAAQHISDISLGCTGSFPLFRDNQKASKSDLARVDSIVLPIALCILGITVRSYRHIFVAGVNLACTLLLGFSIMLPISAKIAINPFGPSIMMSLGIAVSFDYSLFMLARFREERFVLRRSKECAVFQMLSASGHVVFLSGVTLVTTFLLLLAFPQNFLVSVGWCCSMAIISSILVNMSLTPSLLLAFESLSHFDPYPTPKSFFCYVSPSRIEALSTPTAASAAPSEGVVSKRSVWFRISHAATSHSYLILLLTLGATAPFLWLLLKMAPVSDDTLIYLQGSPSLNSLNLLRQSFDEGVLNPYKIVAITSPGAVLTAGYFALESQLIRTLLDTQGEFMAARSVAALSFFDSKNVSLATSLAYLNPGSPLYSTDDAGAYRAVASRAVTADRSATLITLTLTLPPDSNRAAGFVTAVRSLLDSFSQSQPVSGVAVQLYLVGGYTVTMDTQAALYKLVPLEIGMVVVIVVAILCVSFGSLALVVRLIFTMCISLCWTYGMLVLVYQPGPAQDAFERSTPSLANSTGIYWIIPPMTFSILVGLALDYDIFLISRVVEFRRMVRATMETRTHAHAHPTFERARTKNTIGNSQKHTFTRDF
jgi:uncharacterized membrane protein YdfJ with MMPL/SSD domain